MRLTPIPRAIQTPWDDLLTKRTLLHEHLKSFRGGDDFVAKSVSKRLGERRDAAAEFLIASRPDHRAPVRDLPAEAVELDLPDLQADG